MKLKYFNLAKKLSKFSDHPVHKHGACLVIGKKPVGLGFNKMKTSPKSTHGWHHLHAEMVAIFNAGKQNLSKAVLYVYREIQNGTLANSKPCKACDHLIKKMNIKTICYTIDNGYKKETL